MRYARSFGAALALSACLALPSPASAASGSVVPRLTTLADGAEYAPNSTSADCPSGYTCWFGDVNYTGWILRYADVQTTNIAYPRSMSSWLNRNSRNAAWFDGASGSGVKHCMPAGTGVSAVLAAENDTMVSFKIYSGAC